MKSMRSLAAFAVLAIAAVGCGGGGTSGGSALPAQTSPFNPNASNIAPNLLVANWGVSQMQGASYAGPIANTHLSVDVLVHQQGAAALAQYAAAVSNPASPNYRQFLTPQEIATRFGASQSDYTKAAQYFANQGLAVAGWPQRMMLSVSGDQAHMEKAFGVTFGSYSKFGQTFVAPNGVPHFATPIPVDALANIVRIRADHSYMLPGTPRAASGFALGYSPSVVRAAFDFSGAYSENFNGTGVTLGIIGTGPLNTVGSASGDVDLNALAAATNTNVAHVTVRPVTDPGVAAGLGSPAPSFPYAGGFSTPPNATAQCDGPLPTCNPEDGEAQLDVQQAATLAPGANVFFYLGYNAASCLSGATFPGPCPPGTGAPDIGIDLGDAEIQQAIGENQADVISISYGGGESQQDFGPSSYVGSYEQLEYAALASEGIAVFVSTGDSGAAECLGAGNSYLPQQCVSYPSGDQSVTAVGGVTVAADGFGNLLSPILGWGNTSNATGYGSSGGSGGGVSTFIAAEPWQRSAVPGATMREQPDVSMLGDPNTGVTLYSTAFSCPGVCDIGGTSVAAPQMAAMWAVLLSACAVNQTAGACAHSSGPSGHGFRLGNAAPILYALYAHTNIGTVTPYLPYAGVFYDVLYGDSAMANPTQPSGNPIPGFTAMTGYDLVTGVGVPYAGHLIQAITGITVP